MMTNQEELRELIARYNNNQVTEEERQALEHWYATIDNDAAVQEENKDSVRNDLRLRLGENIPELSVDSKSMYAHWKNWIPYVAALLIMGVVFSIWKIAFKTRENISIATVSIQPGGYYATLEIEGGSRVNLKSNQYGVQTGKAVLYADGSSVEGLEPIVGIDPKEMPIYVLTTPKGGTYKVALPDGSLVWLNAESSLRYPAEFAVDQRSVELDGEAYFEIKEVKSGSYKKPFIVKSQQQVIEVLGTKFNVAAYSEDLKTTTTLVEGRVKVKSLMGGKIEESSMILQPGYQSTLDENRLTLFKSVNVEEAMAWKNGFFIFDDVPLKAVMKQIERWYDIEVEYKGEVSDEHFNGKVYRNTKLMELLDILSFSKVNFKMEGRKMIIYSKKETN